jgi:hypothetical protein
MKNVLILGGNYDQLPYIKEIKEKGYRIFLTDLNENCPSRPLADFFYTCGYDDHQKLSEISTEISAYGPFKIFTAAAQFANVGAAMVAEKFSVTYPAVSDVQVCLNKAAFYKTFTDNKIPIPQTVPVRDEIELVNILEMATPRSNYYLKSDFGKSPNYIYRLSTPLSNIGDINWNKDRYFKDVYLLQKEFDGDHHRINIYPGGYSVFSFFTKELSSVADKVLLEKLGVFEKLRGYVQSIGLEAWLIKFDVIAANDDWVALDVGLDPPFRMKNYLESIGLNFPKMYVEHYLEGEINYPHV